jgi:hypothetical protein
VERFAAEPLVLTVFAGPGEIGVFRPHRFGVVVREQRRMLVPTGPGEPICE